MKPPTLASCRARRYPHLAKPTPNFGASARSRMAGGKDVADRGCVVDCLGDRLGIRGGATAMNKRMIGWVVLCLAAAMAIALHSSAGSPTKPADVTAARVMTEAADGNNWLLNGRTFDEQHFSPLKQITDKNVESLGLAWSLDIDSAMGVVAEPIVVDGVIYVSAPQSKIYAVDAASGKLTWKFDPKVRLDQAINGSYSARTNAGVAVWNGKLYVGTGDCRLIAVDAEAGTQARQAQLG